MRVLAKAYGNQPLDRVAVGSARKVIYIAAKSVARSMESGAPGGVGFPRDCVFQFDDGLFDSLKAAWEAKDERELGSLWGRAIPADIIEGLAA